MNSKWTPETLLEHQAFLRGLARRLLDASEADDAVQDTYVAALESSERARRPQAWLGTVLRNIAASRRRARERRRLREQESARRDRISPADKDVARLEVRRRAVAAVLALDPVYRDVVIARFLHGLSVARTARRLDVPRETVRTRQRRALAQLRARLDSAHGGDRSVWAVALAPLVGRGVGLGVIATAAAVVAVLAIGTIAVVSRNAPETPRAAIAPSSRGGPSLRADVSVDPASDPIDRDRDLFGVVVGAAPRRVKITTTIRPFFGNLFSERAGPATHSDADGAFRIRLRRGERVRLRAEADGFVAATRTCLAGERVRIELERGVAATVRVIDEHERAVKGAEITTKSGMRGRTGANGAWTACLPAGDEVDTFARGLYADGRLDAAGVAVLRLNPGLATTGRVVAADTSKPVAGARLSWALDGSYAITSTASDGIFTFAPSGPGRSVFVRAPGFAVASVALQSMQAIALKRGHKASGIVVDESGAPVRGALVLAGRLPAKSDRGGRFVIRGAPEARPELFVQAEGYAPARTRGPRIVLRRGLAVEGRVLDAAGEPRPGVRVLLRARGPSDSVNTDDLGRFRFRDVPAGPVSLHADPLRAEAEAGALDIVLQPASRNELVVRVRTETGEPVSGARVSIERWRTTTGKDGRAVLALRDHEYEVFVQVKSNRTDLLDGRVFGHDVARGPCVVSLRRAEKIAGRVVNGNGEPYAYVVLAARGNDFHGSCWSDESGAFSLAVPAGTTIDMWPTGQVRNDHLPLAGSLRGVRGGTTDLVLRLTPAATRTVRVRVVDPDGNSLAGARLMLRGPPAVTGPDGWVEFRDVPRMNGGVNLSSHRERDQRWIAPKSTTLGPGDDEIVLRYGAAALIRGRVLDASDRPVANALIRTAKRTRGVFTGEDGAFTLPVPIDDPGPFRVEVRARHRAIVRLDGIAPGAEEVVIRIEPRR